MRSAMSRRPIICLRYIAINWVILNYEKIMPNSFDYSTKQFLKSLLISDIRKTYYFSRKLQENDILRKNVFDIILSITIDGKSSIASKNLSLNHCKIGAFLFP